MKLKIFVALLSVVMLAGCANLRVTDPLLASGAKDTIELLPEGEITLEEAQQAFGAIDRVAQEYQFRHDHNIEKETKQDSAKVGRELIYVRCYTLKMDSIFDGSEVKILAFYSKSGVLKIQVSDDTRWANSLMSRKARFEIAHQLAKIFGGSRIYKKRTYTFGSQQ
jgi:hypothetical protein